MKRFVLFFLTIVLVVSISCSKTPREGEWDIKSLADNFQNPPKEFGAYVWWHWPGSNFSEEGIIADLEAMNDSYIAGATIFNITSAVQESHHPIDNNPWPEKTYRSETYWDALKCAAENAERLGLKIGLHNTPGYSTTGGPWIDEEKGMQKVVFSSVEVKGGKEIEINIPVPELPVYGGWGSSHVRATYYKDIALVAVPKKEGSTDSDLADVLIQDNEVMDISSSLDENGNVKWMAPEGIWTVIRIGHAPTMSVPHPVPDDIIGKVLEADKMSEEVSRYHWTNVLVPLYNHIGNYFGKSFTHILIDSYEAESQDWTENFREDFKEICGYDPLQKLALSLAFPEKKDTLFQKDYKNVINRLFLDKGFRIARDMIHEYGLQLFWEPYQGPFDIREATTIADQPMGEFWTGSRGRISPAIVEMAKQSGKRIVGAESFTGRPEISHYTEDPAFLKHSADGCLSVGVNRIFLHHWVHQPFDDRYQPGMGMGWWGTHFGRNQTWYEPGKAFFKYITRCQMILQQGELVDVDVQNGTLHRRISDADIFFVINQDTVDVVRDVSSIGKPELWDAYTSKIFDASSLATECNGETNVSVTLKPDQSMFILFDRSGKAIKAEKIFRPTYSKVENIEGNWDVVFQPKLDTLFEIKNYELKDFSGSEDVRIKYFSGTATYSKTITVDNEEIQEGHRVILDLGVMNDIAEIKINGKSEMVLWYPPYTGDITSYLKPGDNLLEVAVTNNWANRLIGDEQYEPDFKWGEDRGANMGRAMAAFPDWFIKGEKRPSKDRKTFVIWSYFRADSPLEKAGLVGPVTLKLETSAN